MSDESARSVLTEQRLRSPPEVNPIRARKKTFRETVFLLVAFALAIFGQGYLADPRHNLLGVGAGLIGLAVLLSIWVAGSLNSDDPGYDQTSSAFEIATPEWRWPTRVLQPTTFGIVVATAVCLLGTLILFEIAPGAARNVAWALYLIGLALGLVITWRLDGPGPLAGPAWTRRDSIALAAILVVASFFRLWRIGEEPAGLWADEATHGLAVIRLLSDPSFRPVFFTGVAAEPALHWYFDALFFVLFGPTIFALRISAILAGVVAVAVVYVLARQLFGWRTGVVAAAFLAVASWHVNFSRVMFDAIWSVTLNTLAVYFLYQGLRANRYRYFALAGLSLGIGINIYYTSFLVAGVSGLYVVYRFAFAGGAFLKRSLFGLVVVGAFLLLSGAPILEFALLHPSDFAVRVSRVSVFSQIGDAHSLSPLISNVGRHVEMFNYQGDPNGRHNLSGSPELDRVMGALFVLGVALTIRRWRRPEFGLLLIWFPVILVGGILSLDYEAPQSLRTIDNSVVAVLFAAIPLGSLWARLTWLKLVSVRLPSAPGSVAASAGAVLAAALFGWSATLNYDKYFVQQYNDTRTWMEYDSPQTEIGRELNQLDFQNTDVYLSAIFLNEPTIHFLAPSFRQENRFDPARDLPFRGPRAAAVFLANVDDRTVLDIQRFYPNAVVRAFAAPLSSQPGLYAVYVTASDVAALHGLAGDYYAGPAITGNPARITRDATVNFDWSRSAPPLAWPFSVSWRGVIAAPEFGAYVLKLQGPATGKVYVDENLVVQGATQQSVTLATGLHAFRLEATVAEPQPVQLLWQPPGTAAPVPIPTDALFGPPAAARGLVGKYYPSPDWQGQQSNEEVDPSLKLRFQVLPLPRPYSVSWSGKLDVPLAGFYSFGTDSVDSSWIYLDGKLVATNQGQANHQGQGSVRLDEGMHDIQVKFQDLTSHSYLTVYWQPPGFLREPLPGDRLFPPQGAYPDRAGPIKQAKVAVNSLGVLPLPAAPSGGQPTSNPAPNQNAGAPTARPALGGAAIGPLPASSLKKARVLGEKESGPGELLDPRGVAVDASGNVYVADHGNKRVVKYDTIGKFVQVIGGPGDGDGQFQDPVAVAFDPRGSIVVLESDSGWIQRFSLDGQFQGKYGGPKARFGHPRGIALDAAGNIYVADPSPSRIDVVSPGGKPIKQLGVKGNAAGQLGEPIGIAIGSDGTMWVTDTALSRLSHFDDAFQVITVIAFPKASSVDGPHPGLAPSGDVFVSDPANRRVIHFDQSGQPVDQVGSAADLAHPLGLAVDLHGALYVVDSKANQVVVFAP